MNNTVRILHLEDKRSDSDLVKRELEKSGISFEFLLATNKTNYQRALKEFNPDIILSDYSLPAFSGLAAFDIKQEKCPHVPFIIITGTLGEEKAVELIKNGVTDYILKDKLFTLPQKIDRALKEVAKLIEIEKTKHQQEFDRNNLDALINNTKDLMWSLDRDFNLITSNKPFEEMAKLNFGRVILKGESVLDVSYTPEMFDHFKQIYERAFKGESFTEITHFDIPFEFWTEISYYPIYKGNEVIGTACCSRDITKAKLAERQIQKSESFNRGILNSLSSHIAVLDESGTIVAVNESWKRFAMENGGNSLLGYGEGASYYTTCEHSMISGFEQAFEALRGIKEVMNGTRLTFYLEYPCHSPSEKRWFGMRVVKFENSEPMVVVAHQNISERKLIEENLIQSESRLNDAQAIAHLGNWVLNFESGIVTWSEEACRIYGIPTDEKKFTFEVWLSFIHPQDLDYVKQVISDARVSLTDSTMQYRIRLRDGTIKHIQSESKFEFNPQGEPIGLYGITVDETDRKLKEEEREKMITNIVQHSKNLEQFASIVSHNLRAPVANILGLSNVLKNNISEEDRSRGQQFLLRATEQLDDVLKDMVKILQVRSEINEYKETVYFDELVDNIKSSIHNVIQKEMVLIETNFSAIEKITTIKSYLHSIFYNLISNSIKYRQPGKVPLINIKSEIQGENIVISFKDNGIGIDLAKHSEKIFGLYQRFNLNIEGKGLGLFMAKTQIETLAGNIKIKSKPGEGAEFIIDFPIN